MFSLICVWIDGWENNRKAGDLRRYRAHYDVIVMWVSSADVGLCHGYDDSDNANDYTKKTIAFS